MAEDRSKKKETSFAANAKPVLLDLPAFVWRAQSPKFIRSKTTKDCCTISPRFWSSRHLPFNLEKDTFHRKNNWSKVLRIYFLDEYVTLRHIGQNTLIKIISRNSQLTPFYLVFV